MEIERKIISKIIFLALMCMLIELAFVECATLFIAKMTLGLVI